ncbi:hypothetical protein [Planktothricoides raciborskii]|uniref:Secreted protein n=1 Tax=Planktothricoides raciborskii FACHB-1370 TaxID=2949576 RepID=A0ABR8EIX4_9CYAN|nr:hypothetical protein [Planktothricoides raciborskii]MBD2546693.1 hypothetical protein [Planktothricoides raciborskii FACHB-1370]MBD2582657.1 hypothetical protein [Planktothricoides raciborskii FACHB-1261]
MCISQWFTAVFFLTEPRLGEAFRRGAIAEHNPSDYMAIRPYNIFSSRGEWPFAPTRRNALPLQVLVVYSMGNCCNVSLS